MPISELIQHAQKFAIDNGTTISLPRARKVALAIKKRMDKFIVQAETPDEYRSITHSDITGETAVNNILRELLDSDTTGRAGE